jgi:hypothetical protein
MADKSGYGFLLRNMDPVKFINFISNHKISMSFLYSSETFDYIISTAGSYHAGSSSENKNELQTFIDEYFSWNPASPIAAIMNHELQCKLFTDYSKQIAAHVPSAVLYTTNYPWEMTLNDKKMTKRSLRSMVDKYANELGIPKEDIGYWTLSYRYFDRDKR